MSEDEKKCFSVDFTGGTGRMDQDLIIIGHGTKDFPNSKGEILKDIEGFIVVLNNEDERIPSKLTPFFVPKSALNLDMANMPSMVSVEDLTPSPPPSPTQSAETVNHRVVYTHLRHPPCIVPVQLHR